MYSCPYKFAVRIYLVVMLCLPCFGTELSSSAKSAVLDFLQHESAAVTASNNEVKQIITKAKHLRQGSNRHFSRYGEDVSTSNQFFFYSLCSHYFTHVLIDPKFSCKQSDSYWWNSWIAKRFGKECK